MINGVSRRTADPVFSAVAKNQPPDAKGVPDPLEENWPVIVIVVEAGIAIVAIATGASDGVTPDIAIGKFAPLIAVST